MAGPQFFHLQSYARKANKAGQCIAQVLGEAARDPLYSHHVTEPQPCRVVYGLSPAEVQKRHDEMISQGAVTVTLKNGKTAQRGVRQDRHSLLTAVASHPNLTTQVQANPAARADYEAWVRRNIAYLRDLFGDQLVSVIEHVDEEHPHIHAYILPLSDPNCSARDLNPCWLAKSAGEAAARAEGEDDQAAVKAGHRAYRKRARELQNHYHSVVGLASGLTRTGPKRERLSRAQWRARKEAASHAAKTMQLIEDRYGELRATSEQIAVELASKLDQVDALIADAEAEKRHASALRAAAEEEAERCHNSAQAQAEQILAEAFTIEQAVRAQAAELSQRRKELGVERRNISQNAAKEASAVVLAVVTGVITGEVTVNAEGDGLLIRRDTLREQVRRLQLVNVLLEVVTKISALWERLTARLSTLDLSKEQETARDLEQSTRAVRPSSNFGYNP